jgi:hypothetical protein
MDRYGGVLGSGRWALFALAVVGLALSPATALAQGCALPGGQAVNGYIFGVLTETMESAPAHAAPGGTGPLAAGTYPQGQGVRLAQATEQGSLFAGCGTLAGLAGAVTVHAQSRVVVVVDELGNVVLNPVSGTPELSAGPISGNFSVSTAGGNVNAKLSGVLDFGLTNGTTEVCPGPDGRLGPCPLVTADGTWNTNGGPKRSGGFRGLALVPFQIPGLEGWFYLDPTGLLTGTPNAIVPLGQGDFNSFGDPAAKFVITMFQ